MGFQGQSPRTTKFLGAKDVLVTSRADILQQFGMPQLSAEAEPVRQRRDMLHLSKAEHASRSPTTDGQNKNIHSDSAG
jgi:hypothetical protein